MTTEIKKLNLVSAFLKANFTSERITAENGLTYEVRTSSRMVNANGPVQNMLIVCKDKGVFQNAKGQMRFALIDPKGHSASEILSIQKGWTFEAHVPAASASATAKKSK